MYKPMETRDMALEIGRLIKLRKAIMDDNKMSMAAMGVGKSVAVDTIDNIIKYLLDLSREYTDVCYMYKYVAEGATEYEYLTHDITPDEMDDAMKGELMQLAGAWRLRLCTEEGEENDQKRNA